MTQVLLAGFRDNALDHLCEMIIEAMERTQRRQVWDVRYVAHHEEAPGMGWEPFSTDHGGVYWRRRTA